MAFYHTGYQSKKHEDKQQKIKPKQLKWPFAYNFTIPLTTNDGQYITQYRLSVMASYQTGFTNFTAAMSAMSPELTDFAKSKIHALKEADIKQIMTENHDLVCDCKQFQLTCISLPKYVNRTENNLGIQSRWSVTCKNLELLVFQFNLDDRLKNITGDT